jgi:uncharacterized membrane protein YdjX (TVP38/TMEM64 family)
MNWRFWEKKSFHWNNQYTLVLVLLSLILIIVLNAQNPFSLANLKQSYHEIIVFKEAQPVFFLLLFFLVYILSICLIIPDSTLLSLFAGTIYKLPFAIIFISVTEAIGALIFFLIIKFGLKKFTKNKDVQIVKNRLQDRFREHEIYYLLFLRFCHIIPFWLINSVAVIFKTNPFNFLWTAFVGTLPLSYILAKAGQQLQLSIVEKHPFSLKSVFTLPVELSFLGIGLLALSPILIQKYFRFARIKIK